MKWNREVLITVIKLAVKILMVALTARDSWSIVPDILVVALIDGAFFSFMVILEFAGRSQLALALRPMAAAGAWILYGGVLAIGVLAHDAQSFSVLFVFMLARVAAGLVLVFDTWDYIQQRVLVKRQTDKQEQRAGVTNAARRMQAREQAAHGAYMLGVWLLRVTVLPVIGVLVSFSHILRGVWKGTLLADEQPAQAASVHAVLPEQSASVHVGSTAKAEYHQSGDKYYWLCSACGMDSRLSQRSKGLYATMVGCQRGFAGHSQVHLAENEQAAVDAQERRELAAEMLDHA